MSCGAQDGRSADGSIALLASPADHPRVPHEFSNQTGALIGIVPPGQMADTDEFKSCVRHERRGGAPVICRAEWVALSPDEQDWMGNAAQIVRPDPHSRAGSPHSQEPAQKCDPRPTKVWKVAQPEEDFSLRVGPILTNLNRMSEKARKIAGFGRTRRYHEIDQSATDHRKADEPHGERR